MKKVELKNKKELLVKEMLEEKKEALKSKGGSSADISHCWAHCMAICRV